MNSYKPRWISQYSSVFIAVHLWLVCSWVHADWQVKPVSSLQKLTAVAPGVLETFQSEPVALRAVRGEWENFQIVVQAANESLPQIEVAAVDLYHHNGPTISAENIHLFWENYVYVPQPSGNRRLNKLWWPDALIPPQLQTDTSVAPQKSRVLWVNVRVPANAAIGGYKGQIQIHVGDQIKSLPFTLSIGREKLTDVDKLPAPTLRANVAVYYDVLRDWHAKNARALNDDEFAALKKNYYSFLLDYRINAYDLPVDWKGEEAQQYLRDSRVLSVRTPPLERADFKEALAAFKKANAFKKAYYYWIDEPAPEQYDAIRSTTKQLRKLGIQHCVTAHPNQPLEGAVDIWCPNIGDYFGLKHLDFRMLEAQRKKGRETWLYTMAWPRYPYPTWLLDDEASSVRSYGWLMAQNGITGFVYSMAHGWGPKPLENLQSFGETNGDGTLLYPAAALDKNNLNPLPSIRLMLLRDAIEDYELKRPFPVPSLLRDSSSCKQPVGGWIKCSFGSQPKIDGLLNDATWNGNTLLKLPLQRVHEETPPVKTQVWLAHNKEHLFVAARCPLMPRALNGEIKGDWFCVERANPHTRWRFIVTPAGRGIIEKHTREGHFRIEGIKWKYAAKATRDFYNVEMQIPLDDTDIRVSTFNVRRRLHDTKLNIHYFLSAAQDAETIELMPWLHLLPATKIH